MKLNECFLPSGPFFFLGIPAKGARTQESQHKQEHKTRDEKSTRVGIRAYKVEKEIHTSGKNGKPKKRSNLR